MSTLGQRTNRHGPGAAGRHTPTQGRTKKVGTGQSPCSTQHVVGLFLRALLLTFRWLAEHHDQAAHEHPPVCGVRRLVARGGVSHRVFGLRPPSPGWPSRTTRPRSLRMPPPPGPSRRRRAASPLHPPSCARARARAPPPRAWRRARNGGARRGTGAGAGGRGAATAARTTRTQGRARNTRTAS